MKLLTAILMGFAMATVATGALAADQSNAVSVYDRNPACMDPNATVSPDACVIQDGPPPRHFVHRFQQPLVNGSQATPGSGASTANAASATVNRAMSRR